MSLEYIREKIKANSEDLFWAAILILVGLLGFGLGRLSKIEDSRVPITIREEQASVSSVSDPNKILNQLSSNGQYVASKTGTSFYLPWCVGAQKIKENNKIWFKDKEAALAAGLKPASNCKRI